MGEFYYYFYLVEFIKYKAMKNLKLLLQFAILLLFLYQWNIYSQNNPGFRNPVVWLRADKAGINPGEWQDVSGNGYNGMVLNNQTLPDTCLFNYNRCFLFDSISSALKINYTAKKNARMLVFAVYKPLSPSQEKGIWSLGLDSSIQVKLTTQRLKNVYKFIKYTDTTSILPTINLLSQNWRNKHIDSTLSSLIVGGTDSLCYSGKFAEFILYDTTLTGNDIYKLHTYLGIKYGVSIRDMDYVGSNDSVLWSYRYNIDYKNDIAGIGKDSILQVNQKQSAGNGGESPLKIAAGRLMVKNDTNTTQIPEGTYLIWGNNGKMLDDIETDSIVENQITNMSKCVWLMKAPTQGSKQISTQVVFNASGIFNAEDVKLVINRYGKPGFTLDSCFIAAPDSIDSTGNYYFNNIHWDTDSSGSDMFGFKIKRTALPERSFTDGSGNGNPTGDQNNAFDNGNAILEYSMFPNPTANNYTIYIRLVNVDPITIFILDENGKLIENMERAGSLEYTLYGFIKETGCYFVTIKTQKETKTYKLVVQ